MCNQNCNLYAPPSLSAQGLAPKRGQKFEFEFEQKTIFILNLPKYTNEPIKTITYIHTNKYAYIQKQTNDQPYICVCSSRIGTENGQSIFLSEWNLSKW